MPQIKVERVRAHKNLQPWLCSSFSTSHMNFPNERQVGTLFKQSAHRSFVSVSYACGRSTSENGTYFSNPASPQRICTLEVNRISKNICQVNIQHVPINHVLFGTIYIKCLFNKLSHGAIKCFVVRFLKIKMVSFA